MIRSTYTILLSISLVGIVACDSGDDDTSSPLDAGAGDSAIDTSVDRPVSDAAAGVLDASLDTMTTAEAGVDSAATVQKISFAVVGDMPYGGTPTDKAEFEKTPSFIEAINNDPDVRLVLHAGDIHSGKQYCTESYNRGVYGLWTKYKQPLIYTPGDNEWTDCHKVKEGGGKYNADAKRIDFVLDTSGLPVDFAGGNPVDNLTLVRSIFFPSAGKAFGGTLDVNSQAQEQGATADDKAFVENVWLEQAGVLIAAVNIPGGSNNGTDPWYGAPTMSPQQQGEVTRRTAASLHWLEKAFKRASDNNDKAVLLLLQADMWDLDGGTTADMHLTEYKQYIDKLATLATTFGKPVLLINGDSHLYRSDNPFVKGAGCRVEVPSSPIGTKAATTASCADSVASGALKGLTLADPYGLVQVSAEPTYEPTYNVPNFHRIVVHGNATPSGTDLEYVKLTIDAAANAPASETAFGPFSWTRIQP